MSEREELNAPWHEVMVGMRMQGEGRFALDGPGDEEEDDDEDEEDDKPDESAQAH